MSGAPIIEYEYDESETPSEAVITAVAAKSNRDPLTIDPLYETIDPDALDAIFRTRLTEDTNRRSVRVELHFEGEHVEVTTGEVRIYDTDATNTDEPTVNAHERQD